MKLGVQADEGTVLGLFARAGYARVEPPVLQPPGPFLDLSGEALRQRMFVTQDAGGEELCLRPEYTIPVGRLYLERHEPGRIAAFAYHGPVFRHRPGETGEFLQAGIESLGRADREAADAEVLALALEAVAALGLPRPAARLGDVGLFTVLLDALAPPPAVQRRLRRAFSAGKLDAALLAALAAEPEGAAPPRTLDPEAVRAEVLAALAATPGTGLTESIAGRGVEEIVARALARAAVPRGGRLAEEHREVLAGVLAVEGDPDEAVDALRALADDARLDALAPVLDAMEARHGFLAARGVDPGGLHFSAAFGRSLDYYTGFVFELADPAAEGGPPVAGGGRYDGLLGVLGAARPVPAVGLSVFMDRLGARRA